MLANATRWSLGRGRTLVPSRWQATSRRRCCPAQLPPVTRVALLRDRSANADGNPAACALSHSGLGGVVDALDGPVEDAVELGLALLR